MTDNSDVTEEVDVDGNGSNVEGEIEILVEGDSSESEDDEENCKGMPLIFCEYIHVPVSVELMFV